MFPYYTRSGFCNLSRGGVGRRFAADSPPIIRLLPPHAAWSTVCPDAWGSLSAGGQAHRQFPPLTLPCRVPGLLGVPEAVLELRDD